MIFGTIAMLLLALAKVIYSIAQFEGRKNAMPKRGRGPDRAPLEGDAEITGEQAVEIAREFIASQWQMVGPLALIGRRPQLEGSEVWVVQASVLPEPDHVALRIDVRSGSILIWQHWDANTRKPLNEAPDGTSELGKLLHELTHPRF